MANKAWQIGKGTVTLGFSLLRQLLSMREIERIHMMLSSKMSIDVIAPICRSGLGLAEPFVANIEVIFVSPLHIKQLRPLKRVQIF